MKKIILLAILAFMCISCYHEPQRIIYSTNNSRVGIVQASDIERTRKHSYYVVILRDLDTGELKTIEVGQYDFLSWWTGDTIVGYDIKTETD